MRATPDTKTRMQRIAAKRLMQKRPSYTQSSAYTCLYCSCADCLRDIVFYSMRFSPSSYCPSYFYFLFFDACAMMRAQCLREKSGTNLFNNFFVERKILFAYEAEPFYIYLFPPARVKKEPKRKRNPHKQHRERNLFCKKREYGKHQYN